MTKGKKLWALLTDVNNVDHIEHDYWDNIVHNHQWLRRSAGYNTKAELIKEENILSKPCIECLGLISAHYVDHIKEELETKSLCFNCNFWTNKLAIKEQSNVVRVNGEHFMFKPDAPEGSSFVGYGGAEFRIQFADGRYVVSHNLWNQGTIPKHFKDRLPDNAVFLQ